MGSRLVGLLALAIVVGCNPPADYALVGSAYVPAAQGEIDIEKIDGGQILISIVVDHLDSPSQIEPGLTDYVVWFTAPGEPPARQGTLTHDPKARVGRGAFPTSLRELELQITAENGAAPERPSDLLVSSQKIREK